MSDSTPAEPTDRDTTRGLARLSTVAVVAAALTSLTYAIPGLEEARPVQAGDPLPLSRLFSQWEAPDLPGFAGAGSSYRSAEQTRREVSEQLGDAVAANLGEPSGPAAVPTAPSADGADAPPGQVIVEDREHEGISVEIEDPTGRGMAPFYDKLLAAARAEPRAIARVSHFGDSSIAADHITQTVRRRLQTRFGDAGHGFMLPARAHLPYGHRDVHHAASRGWSVLELVRNEDPTGHHGLGGVLLLGGPGEWAVYGTSEEGGAVGRAVSRFQVFFQRHRRGGDMRLAVDRDPPVVVSTRADAPEDAVHTIEVPDGPHRLDLRAMGGGHLRLYGVVLERDGPGVVYDSLGMVGARASRMLHHDPDHIAEQLRARGTDLVVLGFGGNDADDPIDRSQYEEQFVRVIERVRAGRADLGCLVFAPLDQGTIRLGEVVTMPNVPVIVEAQRAAAARQGCAFYDTFQAMGGQGSMARWYRSRPRLALGDYRHATPAGYEVIGNMFYKALLRGFADWLATRGG